MYPHSSSSPSSSMSRRNYGAFLSFRGIDTRNTFISHLYRALDQKGVYTFKDREELKAGQRISELFDAIEGSSVAVVTFSENYARSKWCLDELQKIMERQGQGKMVVIPIFYRVSPREVRLHEKENGEKGCYQIPMEEMETKYGRDSERMKRWREALLEAGNLSGIELGIGNDEGAVVQDVVDMVMKMNRVYLEVAKNPIGIGRLLREIRPSLHMDPHVDDVFMVGIHGQGGAGKTTLSKAICNDIADRFDDWCFLENVRETTSKLFDGLAQLQQKLLRKLLGDKNLEVLSVDSGKQMIKYRLSEKRVLVILDDVEELVQLDALAGDLNWFGKGSRIILTTRNEHVLNASRVSIYKVNLLEREEAENLFRLHAFGTQRKINIDCGLINLVMEYSGKLPLALVLLGAFLCGRSESEWKGKLKELKGIPDAAINRVLKISYDGLEKQHKEIFLDVACFFKGRRIHEVEKILDGCGFPASLGLAILRERCLITIVDEQIEMHDLLVEMGQSIVRDEGNGILNRIWLYEDFKKIMSDERSAQERQAVEGIVMYYCHEIDDRIIKFNTLKDFQNLRILILNKDVVCDEELLQLPRELRLLQLNGCSTLAMEFYPSSELVLLKLRSCKIQQIKAMGLKKLKDMSLFNCPSLDTLPDLSMCRDLEVLKLCGCSNLTGLDEAIGSLKNLVQLIFVCCDNLAMVPSSLRSKRLQTLCFCDCPNLEKIPTIMEKHEFLEELYLDNIAVKELPDSIGNLVALKSLCLSWCAELMFIPSSIYKMQALKELELEYCGKLSGFPRRAAGAATDVQGFPNLVSLHITFCHLKDVEFLDDLTCHETLMSLHLSGNEFTHVPASISKFRNLQVLRLDRCFALMEVSEFPNIPYLNVAECQGQKAFRANLSCSHSLDSDYIMNRWLSLENFRRSVGAISVVFPGREFPNWVKFNSGECDSCYRVSLPRDMLVDDLFGLALFIGLDSPPDQSFCLSRIGVRVNRGHIFYEYICRSNSWWVYIPCQSLIQGDGDFTSELNGLDITLQIALDVDHPDVYRIRWGMHLVCKREEDDEGIKVFKDGDDNDVTIRDWKINLTKINQLDESDESGEEFSFDYISNLNRKMQVVTEDSQPSDVKRGRGRPQKRGKVKVSCARTMKQNGESSLAKKGGRPRNAGKRDRDHSDSIVSAPIESRYNPRRRR